ncbi:MAG: flippase-like domain-containing protein [Bacteroidia bacterium]|nr:flippase-like domain-containing protein [Bacteroidia bacterium]
MKHTLFLRFWWLLKLLVFLLSCWFIWFHLVTEIKTLGNYREPSKAIAELLAHPLFYLVLLLALFNWSLEALKWKFLLRKIENVSFLDALRAFFNGITLSFFTPNRVGEFAGRILYLSAGNRVRGALLTVLGSSAQLLITIQAGLLAFWFFLPRLLDLDLFSERVLRAALLLFFILCTWSWFRFPKLASWLDRFRIKSAWKEKMHVWDQCSFSDLLSVWLLSAGRYTVFTAQQVLLFMILEPHVSPSETAALSALSFFLITVIPSIALGELGIRGSVNLALFGLAGLTSSTILLVTFGLWSINIALPAVLGAVSVLFLKLKTRTS